MHEGVSVCARDTLSAARALLVCGTVLSIVTGSGLAITRYLPLLRLSDLSARPPSSHSSPAGVARGTRQSHPPWRPYTKAVRQRGAHPCLSTAPASWARVLSAVGRTSSPRATSSMLPRPRPGRKRARRARARRCATRLLRCSSGMSCFAATRSYASSRSVTKAG